MSLLTALFDKSFLQSLSVDESVWFDHFFLTNVCPIFFVETLADLQKKTNLKRTPEDEVRIIANKFPEMHGSPNVHHTHLSYRNLLGEDIPLNGKIVIPEGQLIELSGRTGVVVLPTDEADAFIRWRKGEFYEVERLYAIKWRQLLTNPSEDDLKAQLQIFGIDPVRHRSLDEAIQIAENLISVRDKSIERFTCSCKILEIPNDKFSQILLRWVSNDYPAFIDFAPYAAHVLKVEMFYRISLVSNLISIVRSSNKTDISYLYYLPFCKIFISSDHLHRDCTNLFLRTDQEFVWGQDLKNDLLNINSYYSKLPDKVREEGLHSFAPNPPKDGHYLVSKLWDNHRPNWRNYKEKSPHKRRIDKDLLRMINVSSSLPKKTELRPEDNSVLNIQHKVRRKKGVWYLVPKDNNSIKK